MEERIIYAKEFILGRIENIRNLIKSDVFMSFLPMSVLIEVLGKINNPDCVDWNCKPSGKNFKLGIERLPTEYHQHCKLLYESLRCGFAHSLLPQQGIDVTHREESNNLGTLHLHPDQYGNIVIIAETLMDDIENALNADLSAEVEDQAVPTPIVSKKASDFKGGLSAETVEALLKYVEESRNESQQHEDELWKSYKLKP